MIAWETYLAERRDVFIQELMEFLRIPSISSLPEHKEDVQRAARWLRARMSGAGVESVQILATGGHPVVYGECPGVPGKPTILIYGHFDVQPVDPLDQWDNPPFEPVIRDGRIYARGATDNKGNLFIPIIVVEAMLNSRGCLPINVKFLFEGQEEIGSPQLPRFIASKKDLLSCDLVLSTDGGQWAEDQPALTLGTRGLVSLTIDVQGPNHDLHSGIYGGAIANPIHALVRIVDSMHDENGRVTIEGFYDDVRSLTDGDRAQFDRLPFDEAEYLRETGAPCLFGEPGFTTYERTWARPTLEINGLYGGFQGAGTKTVLPSTAHAKISCRLVADQDPSEIAGLILAHIDRVSPSGVQVRAARVESGATPYLVPADHQGMRMADSVLRSLYGKAPYQIRSGGTIPVNSLFLEHLGVYTILYGFGLEDERQHSPNEFFRLSGYERGQRAYGMVLDRLGSELRG